MTEVKLFLPTRPPSALYGLLLSANGDRPLGMQAAQLIGIADWTRQESGSRSLSVKTLGIRNQVTGLVAAGLAPTHFSELAVSKGMKSLGYLLDNAIRYQDAPDLFCLDLYKDFDIDILAALAEPTVTSSVSALTGSVNQPSLWAASRGTSCHACSSSADRPRNCLDSKSPALPSNTRKRCAKRSANLRRSSAVLPIAP
jgi:hypothetical protein